MKSGLRRAAALLLTIAAAACSSTPRNVEREAALALIEEAATAMGGWTAMADVKAQEIQTRGNDWEPLQTTDPDAPPRQVNSFVQTLLVDYERRRAWLTFDATRTYPTTAPVRFVEVINEEAGMLQSLNTEGKVVSERLHPSRLATRLRDHNRMPLRLLHTAKAAPDLSRVPDETQTAVHVLKYTDGGLPVTLHLHSETKLPVGVTYTEDDPVYGDTKNEIRFLDWNDRSVPFPETQVTFLNGKKIREERVQALVSNPPDAETRFVIPDEVKAQPEVGERIVSQWTLRRATIGVAYLDFARQQKVELAEVAPGVFHIRGGSHHSMVVEMKDYLVVVEAPLFDERSLAVIKVLGAKFPGKPIKYLVITHFHFDHTGGVRAYAAAGATLVAPAKAVPFIAELVTLPHTVRPDALARAPRDSTTEGVGTVKELSDGLRTIELRDVPNDHAAGMLIAYLPKEKLVFVSDLYSPPGPVPNPSVIFERGRSLAFYNSVKRAGLAVDTIVGGHGGVGSFRDLEKAVR